MIEFNLSQKQEKKYNKWSIKHKCKDLNQTNHQFRFKYIGGLGYSVKVKCSCGKKINLTDVETW